jgi:hypothetical protein
VSDLDTELDIHEAAWVDRNGRAGVTLSKGSRDVARRAVWCGRLPEFLAHADNGDALAGLALYDDTNRMILMCGDGDEQWWDIVIRTGEVVVGDGWAWTRRVIPFRE